MIARVAASTRLQVTLLTGGGDKPYALGLATSLVAEGVKIDLIGSDFLDAPELSRNPQIRFLNLRGDARPDAHILRKVSRVGRYYARLLRYAATAEPRIFHILWNNRLETFDRTLLMLYYRLQGKRIVLTAHNVNARKRDGNDGLLNRLTLRAQYRLADHLFVHTAQMKRELHDEFHVPDRKISVIPFGINNTAPVTALTAGEARRRLGLEARHMVVLFFGNIAPYKGLDLLVDAMSRVVKALPDSRLVIAGRPKGAESHWGAIEKRISQLGLGEIVIRRIEYVPDEETEIYFKAADLLVLPYTHVFQSGVLFLGYNFGLPVVASDVGSLREDVIEGETGFICRPGDTVDLAAAIQRYFSSDLYHALDSRRRDIHRFASERYSWATVAAITNDVYRSLLESS
jgi:glycosyltransferase involved in cell wall biosynthesis